MDKAFLLENGFSTYGPHPYLDQDGIYLVRFIPRTLQRAYGTRGPEEAPRWEARLLVDSAGDGAVVEHERLDPPAQGLEPEDYEARALELVMAMKG